MYNRIYGTGLQGTIMIKNSESKAIKVEENGTTINYNLPPEEHQPSADEQRRENLKKRIKKISSVLVDYLPEIAGSIVGQALLNNPIVGAVLATAAKRTLARFIKAIENTVSEQIKNKVKKFAKATILCSGKLARDTKRENSYGHAYTLAESPDNSFHFSVTQNNLQLNSITVRSRDR